MLRSRGYTLAEMLIVLAIVGLMAVVGIPWFMKLMQRQALKSAAREIQITLNAARMTAVKRNAPVSVAIASLTPPISFQVVEPRAAGSDADDPAVVGGPSRERGALLRDAQRRPTERSPSAATAGSPRSLRPWAP